MKTTPHRSLALRVTLALAFASGGIAIAAAAPSAPATPGGRFAAADRNGNGSLDRNEFAQLATRRADAFERIDRNRDGVLDPQELSAAKAVAEARRELGKARRAMARAQFRYLDANRDGALTLAEIGSDAPELAQAFGTIDADRDGRITREEAREHARKMRAERGPARS